jgi:endonuclease-3 related protein
MKGVCVSRDKLMEIYSLLFERFGEQKWWPGETTFEVIAGAVLTQNTSWKNVEKAISNLRKHKCLDAWKMYELDDDELAEMIRPAGYYNIKAKRLKNFLTYLHDNYNMEPEGLAQLSAESLREELLGISGIGPETADSIILYGFGKPVFVVDSYTCRVLCRHMLIEPPVDYQTVQEFFHTHLTPDAKFYNEFHALFVAVGKDYCKRRARCEGCPLSGLAHELEYEIE